MLSFSFTLLSSQILEMYRISWNHIQGHDRQNLDLLGPRLCWLGYKAKPSTELPKFLHREKRTGEQGLRSRTHGWALCTGCTVCKLEASGRTCCGKLSEDLRNLTLLQASLMVPATQGVAPSTSQLPHEIQKAAQVTQMLLPDLHLGLTCQATSLPQPCLSQTVQPRLLQLPLRALSATQGKCHMARRVSVLLACPTVTLRGWPRGQKHQSLRFSLRWRGHEQQPCLAWLPVTQVGQTASSTLQNCPASRTQPFWLPPGKTQTA